MSMTPNGDRVLVKMNIVEKSKGGLFLPNPTHNNGSKSWTGTVKAKGKGPNADCLNVGDKVLIERLFKMTGSAAGQGLAAFDCDENSLDGRGCMLLDAEHILGVIE
jgi:co-chaperonin GroES (HSP10)